MVIVPAASLWGRRRRGYGLTLLTVVIAVLPTAFAAEARADCVHLLQARVKSPTVRPIASRDLASLRDIGSSQQSPSDSALSLSPDGRHVAFILTQGEPATNSYCQALVSLVIGGNSAPQILDAGGDLILMPVSLRGLRTDYGMPMTIVPQWSADGKWIAYLKKVEGRTQVWRVSSDGIVSEPVTSASEDVDSFSWSSDQTAIVYSTSVGYRSQEEDNRREGLEGYLYDERMVPYVSNRPQLTTETVRSYRTIDLNSRIEHVATPREEALLSQASRETDAGGVVRRVISGNGHEARIVRRQEDGPLGRLELWASDRSGLSVQCRDTSCSGDGLGGGIYALWWMPNGRDLLYIRRTGWGDSDTAIFLWRPGSHPKVVLTTPDLLIGCQLARALLVCAREGSTEPRRVVSIDPVTGRSELLFDPNPEFRSFEFGAVERLRWRDDLGLECYADLVLPPGYSRGTKLPLLIVQYRTSGFLRGGTGDEVPIFAFAARGYAVLSFNYPPPLVRAMPPSTVRTIDDLNALSARDWAERRHINSVLLQAIDHVVALGYADPQKVGITGLSDGSTTVQYALVNAPDRFAAASVSACCVEPTGMMIYGGIALANARKRVGFPPARGPGSERWDELSIAMNADHIKAPLLMQLPDHGYLLGVDIFMSLREQRKPAEMVVFPDEYHLKWQPAHRLAIYDRNLDWFDFWLRGREDPEPTKAAQYARWEAMSKESIR